MRIKFILTTLFVAIGLASTINGQSYVDHNKAHRRYWYYRTRMINDFISIGTGTGQSIPFNQRGFDFKNAYHTV